MWGPLRSTGPCLAQVAPTQNLPQAGRPPSLAWRLGGAGGPLVHGAAHLVAHLSADGVILAIGAPLVVVAVIVAAVRGCRWQGRRRHHHKSQDQGDYPRASGPSPLPLLSWDGLFLVALLIEVRWWSYW